MADARRDTDTVREALGELFRMAPPSATGAEPQAVSLAKGLDALARLAAQHTDTERCPECGVAAGERHGDGCFFLTGDPADLVTVDAMRLKARVVALEARTQRLEGDAQNLCDMLRDDLARWSYSLLPSRLHALEALEDALAAAEGDTTTPEGTGE